MRSQLDWSPLVVGYLFLLTGQRKKTVRKKKTRFYETRTGLVATGRRVFIFVDRSKKKDCEKKKRPVSMRPELGWSPLVVGLAGNLNSFKWKKK
jgi:hypothetical protein